MTKPKVFISHISKETEQIEIVLCSRESVGRPWVNFEATNIETTGEAAAEWGDCFYDLLANGYPLYKAFDLTKANISARMRLIRQKDMAFAPEAYR